MHRKPHFVVLFGGNDDGMRSILLFARLQASINYLLSNFILHTTEIRDVLNILNFIWNYFISYF